jgi:hypothetical protein
MKTNCLFTAIAVLFMISCAKDIPNLPTASESYDYTGTVTVIYQEAPFDNENIQVTYFPADDGQTAYITLHHIRFVPQMPVTIDVTIPDIALQASGEKTLLSCEKTIPLALGGEYPKYTVTNLEGEVLGNALRFSLNFGKYPTSFSGQRKQD